MPCIDKVGGIYLPIYLSIDLSIYLSIDTPRAEVELSGLSPGTSSLEESVSTAGLGLRGAVDCNLRAESIQGLSLTPQEYFKGRGLWGWGFQHRTFLIGRGPSALYFSPLFYTTQQHAVNHRINSPDAQGDNHPRSRPSDLPGSGLTLLQLLNSILKALGGRLARQYTETNNGLHTPRYTPLQRTGAGGYSGSVDNLQCIVGRTSTNVNEQVQSWSSITELGQRDTHTKLQ